MYKKILSRLFLIAVLLFAVRLLNSPTAFAHQGHEGPKKVLIKENDAIKTMLPEGGKIVRRKEALKKDQYNTALKRWGYSPEEGVYSYFISKDKGGTLTGALFIQTVEYKHGRIEIAVGYDKTGQLTDIKILSFSEKYLKEVTEDILTNGFLDNFSHLKTNEVILKGKSYENEPKEALKSIIAKEIKGTAILFNLFLVKLFQGK